MSRMMNRNSLNAGLITAALLASVLNGCVGYNVYPPEQGTQGFSDPSSPPVYQLMTEALKWTVKKYPPGGQTPPTASDVPIPPSEAEELATMPGSNGEPARVAISLFSSMRPDVYAYAVKQIGQGAVPLTPGTEALPRYMVSRVWVLGDEAKVDVFKPVYGPGTMGIDPGGAPLYQPITVNLRGGLKYWTVTSYRVWSIGTFPPPEPQYLGGSVPEPQPEPLPAPEPMPAPVDTGAEPVGEIPALEDVPSDPA